ncbi:hypothetical protein BGZ49_009031 [Haplosporangium sp. Z 27]|nr:hypothetical protein BGZ49_009031 [Haplosporangium sp. Z 27]
MEAHNSTTGLPGQGSASTAHATATSSATLNDPINNNSSAGLQRRPKPSYFSHPHSTSTVSHVSRPSTFTQWDDTELQTPIESSGMKRTASYSSFLTKKNGSFYKSTLHHARAHSGQTLSSDIHSAPPDDTLPTTLTKTPTYEYYGFVLYLVSGITYDEHANQFQTMNSASSLTDDFVPDLMDIPIGMVNACLYQHIEGISDEEEEVDDDYDDDDGSYFDDSNPSDWENSTEL